MTFVSTTDLLSAPKAAFTSNVVMLVWSQTPSDPLDDWVNARRYDSALQPLDPNPVLIANLSSRRDTARRSRRSRRVLRVVLERQDRRFLQTGARPATPSQRSCARSRRSSDQYIAEGAGAPVTWAESRWVLASQQPGGGITVRQVDDFSGSPTGSATQIPGSVAYTGGDPSSIAPLSGGRAVVISSNLGGSSSGADLERSIIDASGIPGPGAVIALSYPRDEVPSFASRGPDYVISFCRSPSHERTIQRLDLQGRPIGNAVTFTNGFSSCSNPVGLGWIPVPATWKEASGYAVFRRFTADLTPIDASPVPFPEGRDRLCLAGHNGRFLAGYSRGTLTPPSYSTYSESMILDWRDGHPDRVQTLHRHGGIDSRLFTPRGAHGAEDRWILAWQKANQVFTCSEGWDTERCPATKSGALVGSDPAVGSGPDGGLMVYFDGTYVRAQRRNTGYDSWSWLCVSTLCGVELGRRRPDPRLGWTPVPCFIQRAQALTGDAGCSRQPRLRKRRAR